MYRQPPSQTLDARFAALEILGLQPLPRAPERAAMELGTSKQTSNMGLLAKQGSSLDM